MSITLQNVAVLIWIHIDAPAITGTCDQDWIVECERLLGRVPPTGVYKGRSNEVAS